MRTRILAEEKEYLVCFKPSGLAVQSARASEADMVSELKNYLAKAARQQATGQKAGSGSLTARQQQTGGGNTVAPQRQLAASGKAGFPSYLGVIHRLDQPVSGLLVFAKNQRAAAELSRQVADHVMKKTYRAVVWCKGTELSPESDVCRLTDYMIKEAGGGARIVSAGEKDAKKAELIYRCLERDGDRALVEVDLLTGRHHQIRAQMANAGLPLLGDARYGSEESRAYSEEKRIRAVQLQAVKLAFLHPVTGKKVVYELDEKLGL